MPDSRLLGNDKLLEVPIGYLFVLDYFVASRHTVQVKLD